MTTLGELLHQSQEEIESSWRREAQRVASARGLDRPEFDNLVPRFLSALARADDIGTLAENRRSLIEGHVNARLRQGFELGEVIDEISILGRAIASASEARPVEDRLGAEEMRALFDELHRASALIAELYQSHLLHDEQAEKRYARLIQQIASEALVSGATPFRERLREVLCLIRESIDADLAALVLYDPRRDRLITAACVGGGDGLDAEFQRYVVSLEASSMAGRIVRSARADSVFDAEVSEPEVSDQLRSSGIHAVLGIRLPPRRALQGVLYVGLHEARRFSVREVGRLQVLGERLTVHLENAKLYQELNDEVRALTEERELRERFVAVLAHDLRGPLSAAKLSSQLLSSSQADPERWRDLVARMDRNLDRIDRMIRDMLDAHRIHAGEPIPLRLAACDLGKMARELVDELDVTHPGRLRFVGEEELVGTWSADELHRAIWNLAINALKYGAPDAPVTIGVERLERGARVFVHNEGAPIPEGERARLYQPFMRAPAAAEHGQSRGWGLGLTLVQGCARAHGGRVTLDSDEERGTTFAIELPIDSRGHQVEGDREHSVHLH